MHGTRAQLVFARSAAGWFSRPYALTRDVYIQRRDFKAEIEPEEVDLKKKKISSMVIRRLLETQFRKRVKKGLMLKQISSLFNAYDFRLSQIRSGS